MKWVPIILILVGCTAVYISGDNNSATVSHSVDSDADIEVKEEEKEN